MYQKIKSIFGSLLMTTLLAFTHHAAASECYDASPNLTSLGDQYYDFDQFKTFSNDEQDQLNAFFKRLSGKWEGHSIIIDCFGPDTDPEKKVKNATIKAKNKAHQKNSLQIKYTQRIIEDRVNKSELMTLLDNNSVFEFTFLSDNHLAFSEKYRKGNYVKGKKKKSYRNRLVETIYEVKLNGDVFTLFRSYYSNGVYTGEEKWTLRAK